MTSRERGNIWPLISVVAGAVFVLVIMPLVMHREHSSRMATVEAQVNLGDTASSSSAVQNAPVYRWPDSEVPPTAERPRDVTALSVAAITYLVEGAMTRRPPRDTHGNITLIAY